MPSKEDDKEGEYKGGGGKPKGKRKELVGDKVPHLAGQNIEELVAPQEPLLNVFTFGWMEDGRLGYGADIDSYMQVRG